MLVAALRYSRVTETDNSAMKVVSKYYFKSFSVLQYISYSTVSEEKPRVIYTLLLHLQPNFFQPCVSSSGTQYHTSSSKHREKIKVIIFHVRMGPYYYNTHDQINMCLFGFMFKFTLFNLFSILTLYCHSKTAFV